MDCKALNRPEVDHWKKGENFEFILRFWMKFVSSIRSKSLINSFPHQQTSTTSFCIVSDIFDSPTIVSIIFLFRRDGVYSLHHMKVISVVNKRRWVEMQIKIIFYWLENMMNIHPFNFVVELIRSQFTVHFCNVFMLVIAQRWWIWEESRFCASFCMRDDFVWKIWLENSFSWPRMIYSCTNVKFPIEWKIVITWDLLHLN